MQKYYIERVQIEGGFLDGMDVSLKSGLNTIIGARGTGKSTFVELVRYCLGIKGHTADSNAKAIGHARSVLKDGQIIVTLSNGVDELHFSRSSEEDVSPCLPDNVNLPLIFSQTEVENIGLLSNGRLGIVDGFLDKLDELKDKELSTIALLDSFSAEILSLTSSISDFEDKLLVLPQLYSQLKLFELEEKKVSEVSLQAAQKTEGLKSLGELYTEQSLIIERIQHYVNSEEGWRSELSRVIEKKQELSQWRYNSKDPLHDASTIRDEALNLIELGLKKLDEAENLAKIELNRYQSIQMETTKNGQALRAEVDKLQKGAGEISRKCQSLRKDISQLEATKLSSIEKSEQIKSLRLNRDLILDELDNIRSERSSMRSNVCNELSTNLAPKIRVSIEEASQLEEYQQVLINALKGSGIKYNDLAPIIAESIPPRVLLNIIEANDIEEFVSLVSVSKDRGLRVINSLKFAVGKIATVSLEDEIFFELLDGTEYKDFTELSTGQRCTVILPIVLEHKETVLIVDQPEDHIDNAFIVETLISAITRRSGKGQMIVTTHNANVPVLGNAEEVIHLNSDGTRGFVVSEGSLDKPAIVEAISTVMEGGREAFKRRANFYG